MKQRGERERSNGAPGQALEAVNNRLMPGRRAHSAGEQVAGSPGRLSSPVRLERMLVALDFSPCSEKALRYAAALARQFKAQMTLLHVLELYPIDYVFGQQPENEERGWLAQQAKQRLEWLRQLCAPGKGRPIEMMVRPGKPYQEIITAARECGAQLIVMGTHGYTGLQHFQLGSTAERVVRLAPCPVLVVREQEQEFVELNRVGQQRPPRRKGRGGL